MKRKPYSSSLITTAGYNPVTKELEVEFAHGGKVGTYFGITQEEFAAFEAAESKGKFLATVIKPHKGFAYQEK